MEAFPLPALYAHYRFGHQILPTLPHDVQKVIQKHRSFFDMGLQGPDFLFYCHPLSKASTAKYGSALHMQPGWKLFDYSVQAYRKNPSEEALAYLFGFVGHYALDAYCHPYVDQCAREGLCSHSALEAEFDRACLLADGVRKPHAYDLSRYLTLKAADCRVFAPFYPNVTPEQAAAGLSTMQFCYRALATPPVGLKRWVMGLIHHADLMIPIQAVGQWEFQITQLRLLAGQAMNAYPHFLEVLQHSLATGESTMDVFTAPFQEP